MATLTVDDWALRELTLTGADMCVPTLVANANDANGRGIMLTVLQDGQPADMTGMEVWLAWSHRTAGTQGMTAFAEVDASAGEWKCYYPSGMMAKGDVVARIVVNVDSEQVTGSRNFVVRVEANPIDEDEALASDDWSALVAALLSVNEALATATEATEAAESAVESASAAVESVTSAVAACETATEAAASAAQWAAGDYYIGYDEEDGVEYVTFYDLEEEE